MLLALIYNMADCTINIADAEGFGLATFESLACETPIIVNMTGGLQEQVTDGEEWFGVGLDPVAKATIGSQDIPYIFEDRVSKEDFLAAMHKLYNMSRSDRRRLGMKGKAHVTRRYNFNSYTEKWDELLKSMHKRYGSWESRKNYNTWELREI